jgi:hypothetical protein
MTTAPSGDPPPDAPCPCGHSAEEHDPVAVRYCQATAMGGLPRGCICVPGAPPVRQ